MYFKVNIDHVNKVYCVKILSFKTRDMLSTCVIYTIVVVLG